MSEIVYDYHTSMSADRELSSKIPTLPEDKTKHFFVSYSNKDKETVVAIVEELEKRFGLKCVSDDQDFLGGKPIYANIQEALVTSLKVLLFLTPNFLNSVWCKYETHAAFSAWIGGYSCMVPVKLHEECEIPPTLLGFTYIDATIPGADVPAKIASSLLRPADDFGLMPLNIRSWNKINENGYCYIQSAKRDNLWAFRPAKYRFSVDTNLLEKLKESRVEVPEHLLQEAVDIINKDPVMVSYDFLSRFRNFCWAFSLVPLYLLVNGLSMVSWILNVATSTRSPDDFRENTLSTFIFVLMLVSFVAIQIALCLLPNICYRKKREVSLQAKLWRKIGKQCIENNVLLLFTGRRKKKPALHIMRYDIARCKEYLVGIIKSRNITPADPDQTPERNADKRIENYLSEITGTLADDFDLLHDAPFNRHNVKKGKRCICQQLEHDFDLRGQ